MPQRPIRSFVRRAGRMTPGQRRALDELWPTYGIDYEEQPIDFARCFGNTNPVALEIGFGDGALLVEMAARDPGINFLGVEVHEPGIGHCLLEIQSHELANVRVICHDATEVLKDQIHDASLSAVNLFFPDPWPKKRHHKRRIIQGGFLQLLASKLKSGGRLHIATDWSDYAEHIQDIAGKEDAFMLAGTGRGERPRSKFESRGMALGHSIFDFQYVRK